MLSGVAWQLMRRNNKVICSMQNSGCGAPLPTAILDFPPISCLRKIWYNLMMNFYSIYNSVHIHVIIMHKT